MRYLKNMTMEFATLYEEILFYHCLEEIYQLPLSRGEYIVLTDGEMF